MLLMKLFLELSDQHQENCIGGVSGVGFNASRFSVGSNNKGGNSLAGSSLASRWGASTPPGSAAFIDLAQKDLGPNPVALGLAP